MAIYMINQNIIQILKKNSKLKDFLENAVDFEVLTKNLNLNEIKRLNLEYPDLLKLKTDKQMKGILLSEKDDDITSILCITIVKNDIHVKNYEKLKKIKVYFDESKENIIKILQN